MSTIVGTVEVNNNPYHRAELVKKDNQDQFSGVCWQTAGNLLSAGAVGLTATSALVVAEKAFEFGVLTTATVNSLPALPLLMLGAVVADVLAVKLAAECIENANYHLGPEIELRYHPPALQDYAFKPMTPAA